MPIDLKIFDVVEPTNTMSASLWPGPGRVDGIRSLVQKITKNLYTAPGENSFDPAFGSNLHAAVQGFTGADESEVRRALLGVFKKCLDDLQSDPVDDPAQRLVDLRLVDLTYSQGETQWIASVEVETEETTVEITVGA